MNYFYRLMVTAIVCVATLSGYSQAIINDIGRPQGANDLIRGYGQSLLTTTIDFTSNACAPTASVRIRLPQSVTYVSGSVAHTGGSAAIAEGNIADLRQPEFAITGITSGGSITFTIARRAGCGDALTGNVFDSVEVFGACAVNNFTAGTPLYNLYQPAFTLTPPSPVGSAVLGTTANRTTIITNGGSNSATDTLRFFIVYPGGAVANTAGNAIEANSVSFTPSHTNGDTLFYKIAGATLFPGGNPALFENGETVTITEPIVVKKCGTAGNATVYGAAYGRTQAMVCTPYTTATSSVTMATGVANITGIGGTLVNYTNLCAPFDFTVTMANTGTGNTSAAAMYNLLLWHGNRASDIINGPYNIDTNLIRFSNVRINGHSVPFTWTGTIMRINLIDLFPTTGPDPDGAGVGLADVDGDGYYDDLPAGATLTLTIQAEAKDVACGYNKAFYGSGVKLFYDNMCGEAKISNGLGNSVISINSQVTGIGHVPANVQNGVPFQFSAKYATVNNSNNLRTANTRYRWKIVLPAGFSVAATPNARYGTTPVNTWTQVGNTITYTHPTLGLANFYIDLVYTCGTSGIKNIEYFLEEINDITASPECMVWGKLVCETVTTEAKCPSPCPAGPTPYKPVIRRADGSLGWTDNTMATRQSAANISAYDLSKALYMDTLQITGTARQNNAANNLHIHFDLAKTSIAPTGVEKLKPVTITAAVYRGGVLQGTPYSTVVSDNTGATPALQVIGWDLTPALPPGGLLPGDSIATVSKYVVATNEGLPTQDIQSGGNWYFYNQTPGGREYCDSWTAEMYLAATFSANGTNAFNTSGCNAVSLGSNTWNLARRFSGSGQYFETEFRPGFYIDSIVTEIPSAYYINYQAYGTSTVNPNVGGALGSGTGFINVTPDIVNGTKYTFINPGTWGIPNVTVVNGYGAGFNINVSPTCATEPLMQTNVKVYVRDYYYAYATGWNTPAPAGLKYVMDGSAVAKNIASEPAGQTRNIIYSNTGTPNLTLQNLTGQVQGTAATHHWTLQLGNSGVNTAPYTWIAIPDNPKITVTQVLDGITPVAPIIYPGGKMYQLSAAGIASGAAKNYDIHFTYTACTADSLLVLGGWNCSAFPASPAEYICSMDSLYLKLSPQPSKVELSVERQPGNNAAIPLCTQDYAILKVNSALGANLMDPYLVFIPPTGITVNTGTVQVQYPANSGTWQTVTPVAVPGGYRINLADHTGIGVNGLPGVSTPGVTNDQRAALVRIDFEAGCTFSSRTALRFNAYGNRPCGQPAEGNGTAAATQPVNIVGATASGGMDMVLDMAGVTSLSCGEEISIGTSITPSVIPTPAAPDNDTIFYQLPNSVSYVGASITTGYMAIVSGQTLKVVVPGGLPTGVAQNISFKITANGTNCDSVTIVALYKRKITGLSCGATPCTGATITLDEKESSKIALPRPQLTATNPAPVCVTAGYNLTTTVVTATGCPTAGPYTYKYYSNAAATNELSGANTTVYTGGTYYIVGTNAGGCTDTTDVTVTINPQPVIAVTNITNICPAATADVATAVTQEPGVTYIFYNGADASGAQLVSTNVATGGTYSVIATITGTGCKDTANFTVNIINCCIKPDLSVTGTTTVCAPGTVDLSAVVTDASANTGTAGYTYYSGTFPGATLLGSPVVNATGTYQVVRSVGAGDECKDTVQVSVTIVNPPNAGGDGSTTVCDNSTATITLADLITGEQTGGVWERVTGSGGSFVAATGTFTPAAGATTSTFRYVVTGTAPCPNDTSIATVTITAQANAGTDGQTTVCDNSTTTIDLYGLITGEQAGGVWERVSGSGGNFVAGTGSFTPAAGATTAVFRYVVTGTAPCPNDTSFVTVTIIPQARAGADGAATVCDNSTVPVTLADLITGEQPGGVWERVSGSGGTFDANAGSFTPAAGATTSTFRYVVTGTAPCPNDTSIATVTITAQVYAGTDGQTTVCDNSTAPVTLADLITGEQAGGVWERVSGSGGTLSGGNFTPAAGATTAVFRYVVTGTAPCPNDTSFVTVTIIPQARAGADGATTVCDNSTAPVTLADLITGEQSGGVWERVSGSGGTFDANAGSFTPAAGATTSTFRYVVTGTAPCPNDTSIATVTITAQVYAGTDGQTTVCDNSTTAIDLYGLITNEHTGGTWTRISGTGGTFSGNSFTPAPGATTSTFRYIVTGTAPCPNDTSFVTVTIIPQARAGADGSTVECDNRGTTINLFSLISGEQGGGTWTRISGTGGTFSGNSFTPAPGATTSVFRYVVTGTAPCPNDTSFATVTVIAAPVVVTHNQQSCPGTSVDLTAVAVTEGSTPGLIFTYYTNAGATQPVSNPAAVTESGTYYIVGTAGTGCSDTAAVAVLFKDDQAPELTGTLPAPQTGINSCGPVSGPSAEAVYSQYSDNCSQVLRATKDSSTVFTGCNWATTFTYIVFDEYGNRTAPVTITYSGSDQSAPSITAPMDATYSCGELVPAMLPLQATDNCDVTPKVTMSEVKTVDNGPNDYVLVRSWTATDLCGNDTTVHQTITVKDVTAPQIISCANPKTTFADGNCGAAVPAFTGDIRLTDDCKELTPATITQSPVAGTVLGVGVHTITITVTDGNGNSSTCTTSFTVKDNTPPVITACAPTEVQEVTAGNCSGVVPDYRNKIVVSDNCTPQGQLTITQVPAAGIVLGIGIHGITITVTDASGNSSFCTATLEIKDTQKPTISCGSDVSSAINAQVCKAIVPLPVPTINDNCGVAILTWVMTGATTGQSGANGINYLSQHTLFNAGVTTVTYTVFDRSGNSASCSFRVTVSASNLAVTATGNTTCEGGQGTITVTATGGKTPYQYSIDGGSYQSSNIFTATPGIHSITIMDANGCTATTVTTIGTGSNVTATATTTNVSCDNTTPGSITVAATGGTAPYQYSITNGNSYQSSNSFSNLGAGQYTIQVKDVNGCTATLIATVQSGSTVRLIELSAHPVHPKCNETTGSITTAARFSGGTGQLTISYNWYKDGTFYSSNPNLLNVTPGNYRLEVAVTDEGSPCINRYSTSTSILAGGGFTGTVTGSTAVACNSTPAPVITFTATGGTAPYTYTYSFNGGTAQTISGGSPVTITQPTNVAGTYNYRLLSVADASGCSVSINNTSATVVVSCGTAPIDTVPDVSPVITILPAIAHGPTQHTAVIDVHEVNGVNTSGLISVYVSKDDKISMNSWTPSATTMGILPVNNSSWALDATSNNSFYIFTTQQVIPGFGKLSFGYPFTLTPGQRRGHLQVTSTIRYPSGGENRVSNNVDAEGMDYFIN